jgi:hypothetical protein
MKVKVLTSDGIELDSNILDILVWQREFSKDLSYANSFTEVAALFFKMDMFFCSETEGGIECRRRNVKLRVERSGGEEVKITIEMTLNQLLSLVMHELFEEIYWVQNDIRDISKGVFEVRKQVEKLKKVVKRLMWLRVR